jgi:hypothetical protein
MRSSASDALDWPVDSGCHYAEYIVSAPTMRGSHAGGILIGAYSRFKISRPVCRQLFRS